MAVPGNRQKVAERKRLQNMIAKYGITIDDFERMNKEQNGVCKICNEPPALKTKWGRLAVDHCHTTGKVRGLLCYPCNTLLGNANDSRWRLRRAIDYLAASEELKAA